MKDKCDVIRCLDPPKTVRDCRQFCGMVSISERLTKNPDSNLQFNKKMHKVSLDRRMSNSI